MIRGFLLGAALVLGAAGVRPAAAQLGDGRNVTCESGGRLVRCQAAPIASVLLRRDLGKGECLGGDTWGRAGTSIWATRGCRGEFEVVFADGGRQAE